MANENDSFIDEVTEDLRRDRLFGLFRRYGWIAIALILAIVIGAAWREYSIAQANSAAQEFGDSIVAAEAAGDPAAALGQIEGSTASQDALASLLQANALAAADQGDQAGEQLDVAAAALGDDDTVLRDLARLKQVMVLGPDMDPMQRDQILTPLAQPGAPFELLALEQQAVALVGAGRNEDAVALIRQIQQKDGLSEGLRRRLSEMMIAMGVEPEPTDTTPATN
ncbi:tetratricopeptide repeat protein [Paracoccus tegillarcae]|uniref:Ancillary SecYEG translocon subunit/Cell division coordinator CpoB TPR domain-containing protein n=1 Tax=Paracoccus tegillarcae TaxID=1529068 RepID=A0A2K9ESD0_9RHOB|nr:tetratricopeptide repeat protein [Paracoccus tegillarcae]AUH33726.1 hypothetical protein CUV01_10290 [Paracoccus tegillarcae]